MMDIVTVGKIVNAAEYLPEIEINEADAEFFSAVSGNENSIYAVRFREKAVGLAQMVRGEMAFAYVYIFPKYRRNGYGRAALALLEWQLRDFGSKQILTCYRSTDTATGAFARDCGYEKQFASDYMVYTGPAFVLENVPVREYRDEDYPAAHAMYAEAFHRMRVGTGCFPDSVPEAPSGRMRKYWAETAGERLVWVENGEIAGYAHLEGNEIGSVSVKPEMQGKGIGRRFVKEVINRILAECEMVSLYCVVGNDKARSLYDSLGFLPVCRNDYAVKKL